MNTFPALVWSKLQFQIIEDDMGTNNLGQNKMRNENTSPPESMINTR